MKEFSTTEVEKETKPLALDAKTKSFIVPVGGSILASIPETLQIRDHMFDRKTKVHITGIGFTKAKEIKALITESPELEERINSVIAELDWCKIEYLDDAYYHIKQDKEVTRQASKEESGQMVTKGLKLVDTITKTVHKESVIQMVEVPALKEFYKKINELGIDLGEVPPMHITLYTSGDAGGIGINSASDLASLDPQKIEIGK